MSPDKQSALDHLAQTLRAAGHRLTPQRAAVFLAVRASNDHPSAEALFRKVRRREPGISRASVYKALQLLVSLGLAGTVEGSDGSVHYDGDPDLHVNLVCTVCGTIEDASDPQAEALLRRLSRQSGFTLDGRLAVKGTCPACAGRHHH